MRPLMMWAIVIKDSGKLTVDCDDARPYIYGKRKDAKALLEDGECLVRVLISEVMK